MFFSSGIFTTDIGEAHNIYLPKGAIIHTVKHGSTGEGQVDWIPEKILDELTKAFSESEILRLGKRTYPG